VHIVGNLPFAISTALVIKWISDIPEKAGIFTAGRTGLTLLFQQEVAKRLWAGTVCFVCVCVCVCFVLFCFSPPGKNSKEYSRLSVMAQHAALVQKGFDIRGAAFVPPPKVDAGLVTLTPKTQYPPVALKSLETVLRHVFGLRRKMLRNAIAPLPHVSPLLLLVFVFFLFFFG
jgi:dimethyladenosine transferase 1